MKKEIIQALLDGKTVQFNTYPNVWEDLNPQDHPNIYASLFTDSSYPIFRIKPAIRKFRAKTALMKNTNGYYCFVVNTPYMEKEIESTSEYFVNWLTDWVEYNIAIEED